MQNAKKYQVLGEHMNMWNLGTGNLSGMTGLWGGGTWSERWIRARPEGFEHQVKEFGLYSGDTW